MKLHDHLVAGGGRQYAGRPMTRLFVAMSLLVFCLLIAASLELYIGGWPPDLFSSPFWVWVLLVVSEPIFIFLAIRFALTEKANPRPKEANDIRKLY